MALTPPRILTCSDWGAVPAKGPIRFGEPKGIVVHHTTNPNRAPKPTVAQEETVGKQLALSIQSNHMHRSPPAIDTLQNFTVTRGGVILEGRHKTLVSAKAGKLVRGGHTRNAEANRTRFGIEVEGVYHLVPFAQVRSEPQMDALVELIAWLAFWCKFDTSNIGPHRDFSATQCPGHLGDPEVLAELRSRAHARKVEIIAANGG